MNENISLTPQEVADMLKVAKSTVYELAKKKSINSYKVGKKLRIDLKDVEDYKNLTKRIVNIEANYEKKKEIQLAGTLNNPDNYSFLSQFIIAGQDIILDILLRHLELHNNGIYNLRYYQGSYNSLYFLYKGRANMATVHMWDSKMGIYNLPYVERMIPGTSCILINLAYINFGYYVNKGNPKNINNWEDLKRSDIKMVNREKGSGTRILLDEQLKKLNITKDNIKGYKKECLSHIAVASSIISGDADFGLGSEKAAYQAKNIEFIPLQKEQYDLVIKKEDLFLPRVQAVLNILRSKELKKELSSLEGYDVSKLGEVMGET